MDTFITHPAIQHYAETYTSEPNALLQQIERDTHANVLLPRMLSGKLQGRWLAAVSCMMQPKRILEIGTFTGYATLCLAEGLPPDGVITTIDINEELENRVRKHFSQSALHPKIDYRIGDAKQIIPTLHNTFDLVFIDADKKNNNTYFDLLIDKVRNGGWIIVDNVLWSGKVVQNQTDKDTTAITAFNERMKEDKRVNTLLLPVRDGLLMIQKK
ncbi:MAG: O-methyltransferase [Cyclobacteriaceae bacterium]|jgi:caffeoyl-CoA O-methyltransferase|nr:O-methyltransferase [Cytophagales bacterium]MCZ8327437.1 O-methyltransferase [Cyclobacteriaceae bacterium]